MDNDKLARWLSILANFSVLAGIIFLAVEISQNNDLLESEARNSRAQNRIDGNYQIISSPLLISALAKGNPGTDSLTPGTDSLTDEEEVAFRRFVITNFISWQLAYEDYQAGFLNIEDLPLQGWRSYMQNDIYKLVWNGFVQQNLRRDFIDWFSDSILEE